MNTEQLIINVAPPPHPVHQKLAQTDPFVLWSGAALSSEEMNKASVAKYASLWNTWRAWLLSRARDWHTATAQDIRTFLDGPSPGTVHSSRKPINPRRMSSYTRQRYWSLLRGVYAKAVSAKLLQENPALALPDQDRPSIARSDRQSQVLEPFVFERLRNAHTIRELLPLSSDNDWWHVRDRALIAILVSTGITSAELLGLRGVDVCPKSRCAVPTTVALPFDVGSPDDWVVDIMATSTAVGRTMALKGELQSLVQEWARCRQQLLLNRCARAVSLSARAEFLKSHDLNGAFFLARRAKAGSALLPGLDQVSLYYTVSQTLLALRKSMGLDRDNCGPHVAKGPAVIRNSVLRCWLDHYGADVTVRLAGLKSVDSLRIDKNC